MATVSCAQGDEQAYRNAYNTIFDHEECDRANANWQLTMYTWVREWNGQ